VRPGGKTRKEAARQLGLAEGTVASRLARGRAMLARRLAQRGVAFSGGALAVVLSEKAASACVPPSAVSATVRVATLVAAGQEAAGVISTKVAALTEGVLKAMLVTKLKTAAAVLLMLALVGIGGGAAALLAGDEGGRVGYQPPGAGPAVAAQGITTQPGQVALDAAGGRAKPYFYSPPDPTNINHLWKLTRLGDYYLIESKLGELALDASGGRGNPYLRHSDPTNINHLWKLTKFDECYLILPKVGEGELALDANGGRNSPYFSKPDPTNVNQLWQLRKSGDYYLIVPLVRRAVHAVGQEKRQGLNLPKGPYTERVGEKDTGKRADRTGKAGANDPRQREKELYSKQLAEAQKAFVKWKAEDEANLRNTLLSLAKHRWEAGEKGDWREEEKVLADDLLTVSGYGRHDKAANVEAAKHTRVTGWAMRGVEVRRVSQDVAILTYVYDCDVLSRGGELLQARRNHRASEVWARRKGGWVLVFCQETVLPGGR
jgi:hypothetical protein